MGRTLIEKIKALHYEWFVEEEVRPTKEMWVDVGLGMSRMPEYTWPRTKAGALVDYWLDFGFCHPVVCIFALCCIVAFLILWLTGNWNNAPIDSVYDLS